MVKMCIQQAERKKAWVMAVRNVKHREPRHAKVKLTSGLLDSFCIYRY